MQKVRLLKNRKVRIIIGLLLIVLWTIGIVAVWTEDYSVRTLIPIIVAFVVSTIGWWYILKELKNRIW